MLQEARLPKLLNQARTTEGIILELRRDPRGALDLPGVENVLIGIHVGAPAKLACRRGGKRYSGTAVHGDIEIIPAHTPSQWEMQDENDTTLLLSLPQTLLRAVANDYGLDAARMEILNRFQIRDSELEVLCWAMKREMDHGYRSGRLYLDGLALAAASRLVTRHSSIAKPTEDRNEGLGGKRLKKVLSFIEDQLAEDLSLEQIATVAGVSASHLNTLFRMSMGVPVHQYLIQRRVERAKALLMQDGLSMAEIAQAAGFAHQSHMARHMRRVLGMPPRAMKRLLAEAPSSADLSPPIVL
ncbi:MAG: helix-turn-helix domain-containing protein [Pyrinomonadaceae bacterium]